MEKNTAIAVIGHNIPLDIMVDLVIRYDVHPKALAAIDPSVCAELGMSCENMLQALLDEEEEEDYADESINPEVFDFYKEIELYGEIAPFGGYWFYGSSDYDLEELPF